jgi:hypothetical protein
VRFSRDGRGLLTPFVRPDEIQCTGTRNDTKDCGKRWLREMEPVPDEQRKQRIEYEEKGECQIGDVGARGLQLLPNHGGLLMFFIFGLWKRG